METTSFNGTHDIIQNYCITFTHNFNHKYSRFTNSFVIKAAEVNKEKALQIANILFPEYTDIKIESIENDENTLTPSEYDFILRKLREERQSDIRCQELKVKDGRQTSIVETEYDQYLLKLIKKMDSRMNQFPLYHT